MADYFDNIIFSSSIIIFVTALICIFVYEFFFTTNLKNNSEKSKIKEKVNKKSTKIKQYFQSDRVE